MGRHALWWRWCLLVTLGELAGFSVPAAMGVWSSTMTTAAQLAVMVGAGAVEGAFLGAAQAVVLRRALPGFRSGTWVGATAAAAAGAWFLGMLPSSTTHLWSRWPVVLAAAAGAVAAVLLLASIGTAQAAVLPAGVPRRWSWVGWTALGWCAGLVAFSAVAPPLWHEGQATGPRILVGLAGALAMAGVMAAVTGVGMVRLVARSSPSSPEQPPGPCLVSGLLPGPAYDEQGHRLGRVVDLVVDLSSDLDRAPVTDVVVRTRHGRALVPWRSATRWPTDGWTLREPLGRPATELRPTELLVRQDILDSPVVTADPPRRARVSDVVLEIGPEAARVVGLDLSPAGTMRRLAGRTTPERDLEQVPLSQVHLTSQRGHAAHLVAPGALVHRLPAHALAEVLTRTSVAHAREIALTAEQPVREHAVRLLHPLVRDRVVGRGGPPHRLRRLGGWRLHRPGAQGHQGGHA